MIDPFLIDAPAVISFSGGRTSGYMLWRILQAHGGVLPDDVLVVFANTVREMPATLDFVRDCGEQWDVEIVWLEYCREPGKPSYKKVDHATAARAGEPFEVMLGAKKMLPNPVSRFCTIELKIRTIKRFIVAEYGWKRWWSVVGLRADEPGRVGKATDPEKNKKDRWDVLCPLSSAACVISTWRDESSITVALVSVRFPAPAGVWVCAMTLTLAPVSALLT